MIAEAILTIVLPATGVGLYKAIRVEQEVEANKEDIKYIRERVDRIFDHLLEKK